MYICAQLNLFSKLINLRFEDKVESHVSRLQTNGLISQYRIDGSLSYKFRFKQRQKLFEDIKHFINILFMQLLRVI